MQSHANTVGFFFLSKLFNFSVIFVVPVPFCQLVRIWSLFLSILLASKYLQPNFEVQGVKGSLIVGLISTVLASGTGLDKFTVSQ